MRTPPSALTIQEEEQAFYAALGRALAQWQRVEENLAVTFSTVAGGSGLPDLAANAAFYAVLNFNTKLTMTTAAIEMKSFLSLAERPSGPDPMLAAWTPIKKRAERRVKHRN